MEFDYKIVEERADANGNITYQRVRFYSGAVTTEDEFDYVEHAVVPVTVYRRTAMVDEIEYTYGN
jgi:hypothetical protein